MHSCGLALQPGLVALRRPALHHQPGSSSQQSAISGCSHPAQPGTAPTASSGGWVPGGRRAGGPRQRQLGAAALSEDDRHKVQEMRDVEADPRYRRQGPPPLALSRSRSMSRQWVQGLTARRPPAVGAPSRAAADPGLRTAPRPLLPSLPSEWTCRRCMPMRLAACFCRRSQRVGGAPRVQPWRGGSAGNEGRIA